MSSSAGHSDKAPQPRKSPEKRKAPQNIMSTQRASDRPLKNRSALEYMAEIAAKAAPAPIPVAAPAPIPVAAPAPIPVAAPAPIPAPIPEPIPVVAPVQHNEALKNRIAALRKETQGASLRAARDNTTKALQCAANANNAANNATLNATQAGKLQRDLREKLLMSPAQLMEIAKSAHRAADMSAAAAHECTKIASGIATSKSQTEALNMLTRTAEECYTARSTSDTAIALANSVRLVIMLNM